VTGIDFEDLTVLVVDATLRARGRSIATRKNKDLTRPAASWTAPARIGSEHGTGLSVVFSTKGCSHAQDDSAGCTMCSYLLDGSKSSLSTEQLLQQFSVAYGKLDDAKPPFTVKLYTSGSFLDPEEVPIDARDEILRKIASDERVREVVIESRAQYIDEDVVSSVKSLLADCRIEIGLGVESSADVIRSLCINKGSSTKQIRNAIDVCKTKDIGIRAYVLLKPPFLTEQEALKDAKQTVLDVAEWGVSTVSINPVNVQRYTLVERLWERGQYRPPWLWSLIQLLVESRLKLDRAINIVCDPVAGGKRRGVHNCGQCDDKIVNRIREFSLTQNETVFEEIQCECKDSWTHILQHEDVSLLVHTDDYTPS
jgi:radical SAM enzyme (TIGR01210 family)